MHSQHVHNSITQLRQETNLPSLRVVWQAMRTRPDARGVPRLARVAFTLAIDVLDEQHAMIEAWTESRDQRGTVFHRQLVRCDITHDGRHLHLDATDDHGHRWLRLTVPADTLAHDSREHVRPVFAQTSLLAQAGFAAGTFDPPVMQSMTRQALATA